MIFGNSNLCGSDPFMLAIPSQDQLKQAPRKYIWNVLEVLESLELDEQC